MGEGNCFTKIDIQTEMICDSSSNLTYFDRMCKSGSKNIIGCKDSTYNLYENLKIKDFLIFPGDESKLLKGLEIGCSGCISAIAMLHTNWQEKFLIILKKINHKLLMKN